MLHTKKTLKIFFSLFSFFFNFDSMLPYELTRGSKKMYQCDNDNIFFWRVRMRVQECVRECVCVCVRVCVCEIAI